MRELVLRSGAAEVTRAIGARLGTRLQAGDVVALTGELGAGKTCLVQGAAQGLGVTERVTSPSFLLRRDYPGRVPVLHLDVYRLHSLQEVVELGWDEALDHSHVVFVEWGDAMSPLLPDEHLEIDLRVVEDGQAEPGLEERRIRLLAHGAGWTERLERLSDELAQWREAQQC